MVDGQVVGSIKSVKQVVYLEIKNAGHYVFADQKAVMNSLIKKWIENDSHSNLKYEVA